MFVVHVYLAYLVLSIAITVWVARTLHQNGRAFLLDAFTGQTELADSVNHLLVVGFYLINLGWMVRSLRTYYDVDTVRAAIELLSEKVGVVLLVLALMHFLNLYLFTRIRRRALDRLRPAPPPMPPTHFMGAR